MNQPIRARANELGTRSGRAWLSAKAATEGATHLEIALQVGVTPGTVLTSLSRVRADLREQLEAEGRRESLRQLGRSAGLGLIPPAAIDAVQQLRNHLNIA
jgi:hypothetical protein